MPFVSFVSFSCVADPLKMTLVAAPLLPHHLARQMQHIEMEHEARRVGRNKLFALASEAYAKGNHIAGEFLESLRKKGISSEDSEILMRQLVRGLCNQVYNNPLEMMIEKQLYERYDVLRACQFTSLLKQNYDNSEVVRDKEVATAAPRMIFRAGLTMNCVHALFADELYAGKTRYAEPYKKSEVYAVALKLHGMWQKTMNSFKAGDEYDLIDSFGRTLGIEGWYELIPNETIPDDGGVTNEALLKTKQPATVMYLMNAIQRVSKMSSAVRKPRRVWSTPNRIYSAHSRNARHKRSYGCRSFFS